MTTTNAAPETTGAEEIILNHTTIRYEGSIEQFRGLYGWVENSYEVSGETRYDIVLSVGAYIPVQRLARVRRQSLVVGENLG